MAWIEEKDTTKSKNLKPSLVILSLRYGLSFRMRKRRISDNNFQMLVMNDDKLMEHYWIYS